MLFYEPEAPVRWAGFRCGFLGLPFMEIIERLDVNYDLDRSPLRRAVGGMVEEDTSSREVTHLRRQPSSQR